MQAEIKATALRPLEPDLFVYTSVGKWSIGTANRSPTSTFCIRRWFFICNTNEESIKSSGVISRRKQLHVISDGKLSLEDFAVLAGEMEPFVDRFHLREKHRTLRDLYTGIKLLYKKGIPIEKIVINDRVDVAWVFKAGVQLAFHSLPAQVVKRHFPDIPIGCSVHSPGEAEEAAKQGADYILFGHIYPTDSKKGIPPRGIGALEAVKERSDIPVLAIGGIKPDNVPEVLGAGADGIAVMSGILQAKDPVEAAKLFAKKLYEEG